MPPFDPDGDDLLAPLPDPAADAGAERWWDAQLLNDDPRATPGGGAARASGPAWARARARQLRDGLTARVLGHEEVAGRLALAGLQLELGGPGPRLWLTGVPGIGKATMVGILAGLLTVPLIHVPVADLVTPPSDWPGTRLADVLADAVEAWQGRPPATAVVLLDGVHQLAVGRGDPAARRRAREQRQVLLRLLSGRPVRYAERGQVRGWSAAGSLVVATAGVGDPRAVARLRTALGPGLIGALGAHLHLLPPTPSCIAAALPQVVAPVVALAASLGLRLELAPEALAVAAREAVLAGGGVSHAAARIEAEAHRLIQRTVASSAAGEGRVVLAPDDLLDVPR